MSRSNPPPPSDVVWGGHVLVVEMHAGTQPPLWITLRADTAEPALLRLLEERSPEMRAALAAAVDEARGVEHPSLHPAAELLDESGALGLQSAYVEGISLTAIIQRAAVRRKALPQPAALRIAADLLEAVAAAEEHGLAIAGGMRPDFVLVGVDGRTRLLEPCASRLLLAEQPWSEDPRCASYASPEQLEHGEAGARSDVFTAGVLLWEMLANRRLFMGSSYPIVAKTVMQGDVRPLTRVAGSSVDARLAKLVAAALVIDPDERLPSAAEFADELRNVLAGADAHAQVGSYLAETQAPLLEQRRLRLAEARGEPMEPPAPPPAAEPEPPVVFAERPAAPKRRKSERPARAKRASQRPSRKSDRPKRSPPAAPAETPFPVVRRADEAVIRARDILDAEQPRRRWPLAMIGIGVVAMAVGSGIAVLRHGAAENDGVAPQRENAAPPPAEEPPAREPPATPPPAPARVAETEPADDEPSPAALAEPAAPAVAPKPPVAVAAPKPKPRQSAESERPAPPPPKPAAAPKETPPAGDFDPGGI